MTQVTVKNYDELIKALTKIVVPIQDTATQWQYDLRFFQATPADTSPEHLQQHLDAWGLERWELVAVIPGNPERGTGLMFLYKRPIRRAHSAEE